MMTSVDWRTIGAGLEMNREIALRLGYRVEQDDNSYYLIRPDGRYVWGAGTLSADKRNVANGRRNPLDFFDPTGNADVPNWSGSTDAALTLPFEGLGGGWDGGNSLVITLGTAVWVHYMMTAAAHTPHAPSISYGGDTSFGGLYSERLALAICLAWLAWKESQA